MSRLADIPVRIEPAVRTGGLGGGVTAILAELAALLERLAEHGDAGAIDLRSLPMSAQDRAALQAVLGEGEVQATLQADGASSIRETQVAGVWWIENRDRHGEIIAELLEVAAVPLILGRAADEIAAAARRLRAGITVAAATGQP
jgi:hydrogenase-1 operon protein HyaF